MAYDTLLNKKRNDIWYNLYSRRKCRRAHSFPKVEYNDLEYYRRNFVGHRDLVCRFSRFLCPFTHFTLPWQYEETKLILGYATIPLAFHGYEEALKGTPARSLSYFSPSPLRCFFFRFVLRHGRQPTAGISVWGVRQDLPPP